MAAISKAGISTNALILGGTALSGYILTKPASATANILGNNVAQGYSPEDNGVLGVTDILDRYASPFFAAYTPDTGDGQSVNKQIYSRDLDSWDSSSSSLLDGYMQNGNLSAHARAGVTMLPHVFSASTSAAGMMLKFEGMRKSWYLLQSLASTRIGGTPFSKSHLEMRVLGGMKFNSKSFTGTVIGAADDVVSSSWNFIKSGFNLDELKVPEKGGFLRETFLYDGKKGFENEVEKLAKFSSISDIGVRDKFLFSRTFNAIDNLGLSEDRANALKQDVMRSMYHGSTPEGKAAAAAAKSSKKQFKQIASTEKKAGVGNFRRKMSKQQMKAARKANAGYSRHALSVRNSIRDGLTSGAERIAAEKEGIRAVRDSAIVKNKLTKESIEEIAKVGAKSVARRRFIMRVGTGVGVAALAVPIATQIAAELSKQVANTVHSVARAYDRYTHSNFGYDDYQINEASKSERQQAVEQIQNASLNARYLLGNEASMYHR